MKTFIIQMDQHDDILSACDKMRWSKSGRILLVWPERERILNRRLDLVLLQRQSHELGAKLAFVSRDPEIRYQAPRLGIPVFRTLKKAQSAPWRVARRFRKEQEQAEISTSERLLSGSEDTSMASHLLLERPTRIKKLHPALQFIAFLLGVLAFLSIAALLYPSAEISLDPERRTQESIISVHARSDLERPEISGSIPANWISVTVEGRDRIPASGFMRVPRRMATGRVQFTNLTDQPLTIPEGTIVRTDGPDGFRFTVTKSGQISAGPGTSISLPVRCLTPGPKCNLPTNKIVAIEGILGTQVSVNNPFPTRNGDESQEPAPNQEDRENLFSELQKALEKTALLELNDLLAMDDILIPSSLQMVEVIEEQYQPAENLPADHLELNLQIEYQALSISGQDLNQLAQMVLDSSLPADYKTIDDLVTLEHNSQPQLDENKDLKWRLLAQREIQAILKEPQTIQLVLGQTPTGAQMLLSNNLPIEAPAVIKLSPDWWPRLPILPFRILVLYTTGGSLAQSPDPSNSTP